MAADGQRATSCGAKVLIDGIKSRSVPITRRGGMYPTCVTRRGPTAASVRSNGDVGASSRGVDILRRRIETKAAGVNSSIQKDTERIVTSVGDGYVGLPINIEITCGNSNRARTRNRGRINGGLLKSSIRVIQQNRDVVTTATSHDQIRKAIQIYISCG